MWHNSKRRRGAVIVLVAICLTAMVAIVALAVDGGLLMDQRRRVQSAADAAALAAAIDLFNKWAANNGQDTNGTAKAGALSIAKANSYNNDGTTSTVTVNIPPKTSANYNGLAGYAEVNITYNQQRGFSAIFGNGTIPITAHAVAAGQATPFEDGMLLLGKTGQTFKVVGNADVDVSSGDIHADTTDAAGAGFTGNATITAPGLELGGNPGYSVSGGNVTLNTTVTPNAPYEPDPFAYLPPPSTSGMTTQSNGTLKITGKNPVTLNPGLYIGGISISGQANVTLNPGIYYMQGGGFSDTGQGSLTGNGVMIYNDGGGAINIAGQGTVTLSPPTNLPSPNSMYDGFTLFQNRTSTQTIQVTGNGGMNITGTFYAADALLKVTGNGSNNIIGSQYVSNSATITGNGTVDVSDKSAPRPFTRLFGLVE
jgi:hypothetical protein